MLNKVKNIIWDLIFLSKKDKSQFGEEELLKTYVIPHENKFKLFLEIGAHQPVKCSNSYLLYKKGWIGISLDADSQYKLNWRLFRPNSKFKVAAVMPDQIESTIFYRFENRVNLVSTTDLDFAKSWEAKGFRFDTLNVTAINICKLWNDFIAEFSEPPSLLLVDVEGLDYALISKLLSEVETKPRWILCEDHQSIDFSQIAKGYVPRGKAGPSVLLELISSTEDK